jgi:hypothetical protein
MVPILSEHTALERTDQLGALSGRTHVWNRHGFNAGDARLADVRVRLGPAVDRNLFAWAPDDVSGPDDVFHLYFLKRFSDHGP